MESMVVLNLKGLKMFTNGTGEGMELRWGGAIPHVQEDHPCTVGVGESPQRSCLEGERPEGVRALLQNLADFRQPAFWLLTEEEKGQVDPVCTDGVHTYRFRK